MSPAARTRDSQSWSQHFWTRPWYSVVFLHKNWSGWWNERLEDINENKPDDNELILINTCIYALLLPLGVSCPTLTLVWCMDSKLGFYGAISLWRLLADSESWAAADLRWQKAGAVYHPATSPASCLGRIYQLGADAPWHLLICHHRHKPSSLVKCQPPELAGESDSSLTAQSLKAGNLGRHQQVQHEGLEWWRVISSMGFTTVSQ